MKMKNKIISAILIALMLVTAVPMGVFAASIDTNEPLSLTVECKKNAIPLSDAKFSIYLVADSDVHGTLTVREEFEQFNVEINGADEEHLREAASTLEGCVLKDSLTPFDSGKTDSEGSITFPTSDKPLEKGLYLVLAEKAAQDGKSYEFTPFFILLPTADKENDLWIYDVSVSPKYTEKDTPDGETVTRKALKIWNDEGKETERPESITVDLLKNGKVYKTETLSAANGWSCIWEGLDASAFWTVTERTPEGYTVTVKREGITFAITNTCTDEQNTPTPPSREPSLPQTGLLWWPVYTLTSMGLLFMVIGLIRRRSSYDK